MKHNTQTPFALTLGATLITGLTSTVIHADPFVMTDLSSGYQQTLQAGTASGNIIKVKDGSCGEGKCGGVKPPSSAEDINDDVYEDNEIDSAVELETEDGNVEPAIDVDETEGTDI